jgi:Cys-tRNA(Pro)/Cys-tRNA(Cys) deacylase
MAETRGTTALRDANIDYRLLEYEYAPGGPTAEQAADALGVEYERMFKSLVAKAGDRLVFALVPADAELSLKKLAAAAGEKSAAMAKPAEAERATGYRLGGISPLGSQRPLPVHLDETAELFDRICLNAGGRGKIVDVPLADLVRLTGAETADLQA